MRHITSMAELVCCKRGMLSPGRSMGVYSGHDFKAQCARCFSVTENRKMFIINSVINISLFVYTLLARGANLKIQAVLNKRWQTFLLLIFFSCKANAFFRTPEKLEINTPDFRTVTYHLLFILFAFEKKGE